MRLLQAFLIQPGFVHFKQLVVQQKQIVLLSFNWIDKSHKIGFSLFSLSSSPPSAISSTRARIVVMQAYMINNQVVNVSDRSRKLQLKLCVYKTPHMRLVVYDCRNRTYSDAPRPRLTFLGNKVETKWWDKGLLHLKS